MIDVTEYEQYPIEALRLSARANNCLLREGIRTVGQLPDNLSELLEVRNMGRKSVVEIRAALSDVGALVDRYDALGLTYGSDENELTTADRRMIYHAQVKAERLALLKQMLDSGLSRKQIAHKWGISIPRVGQLVAELHWSENPPTHYLISLANVERLQYALGRPLPNDWRGRPFVHGVKDDGIARVMGCGIARTIKHDVVFPIDLHGSYDFDKTLREAITEHPRLLCRQCFPTRWHLALR